MDGWNKVQEINNRAGGGVRVRVCVIWMDADAFVYFNNIARVWRGRRDDGWNHRKK